MIEVYLFARRSQAKQLVACTNGVEQQYEAAASISLFLGDALSEAHLHTESFLGLPVVESGQTHPRGNYE
jgi:hypothetical protein